MGDELDENFIIEDQFIINSDDSDEELPNKKRKAELVDDSESEQQEQKRLKKKQKLEEVKANKKKNKKKPENIPLDNIFDQSEQLNYLKKYQDIYCTKNELEPIEFEEGHFFHPKKAENNSPENITKILKQFSPEWEKMFGKVDKKAKNKQNGAPTLIVVSDSAIKAVELIRKLKEGVGSSLIIPKLFSKHMKIQEQVDLLTSKYVRIVVGTPNRILKLAELGSLDLSQLKLFIIDKTGNVKGQNIFTTKDIAKDLYKFLNENIYPVISSVKICIF